MKIREKSFEQIIRDNTSQHGLEGSQYIVRVLDNCDGQLKIYIRPENRDGETIDFLVNGNNLVNATQNFDEQTKN